MPIVGKPRQGVRKGLPTLGDVRQTNRLGDKVTEGAENSHATVMLKTQTRAMR